MCSPVDRAASLKSPKQLADRMYGMPSRTRLSTYYQAIGGVSSPMFLIRQCNLIPLILEVAGVFVAFYRPLQGRPDCGTSH